MKVCMSEVFKVETTRPLSALNKVGIAELAQFTHFIPHDFPFSAAWQTLVNEWKFEYEPRDDEYQTMSGLQMFFKDGSSIKLKRK
jgi:hypothetical protein